MARILVVCAVALGFAAPGIALPASAKQDPQPPDRREKPRPSLDVRPSRVPPGGVVHVRGGGCRLGQRVSVLSQAFAGARPGRLGVVRTRARRGGGFAVDARLPRRTPRGRYAVAVRCGTTDIGVLAWFRVV